MIECNRSFFVRLSIVSRAWPAVLRYVHFECVTLVPLLLDAIALHNDVMRSAPSVEDCIKVRMSMRLFRYLFLMFFSTSAMQFFPAPDLNPLNTTGVNSRCCLSCTCAHIRACAYECSHLLLFTVRRAPLCQSVQKLSLIHI